MIGVFSLLYCVFLVVPSVECMVVVALWCFDHGLLVLLSVQILDK